MKAKQQSSLRRVLCPRTFIMLLVIAVLGCSQEIVAQQWTTNGNDISNTNSGNVGVGVTTPDVNAKLHVFKPLGAGVDIQSPNSGGWSRVRLVTGTRTYGWFAGDASNSDAPNKIGLYDYNALAFRMMVDSSGNVGIGTSNPNRAKLEISHASLFNMSGGIEINASGLDTGLALGADATNNIGWIQSLEPGVSFTTRPLALQPNGGNVGIGMTNPTRPLEVLASNGEAVRLYRNVNNVSWGVNMTFAFNNSSGAKVDYAGLHGVIGTNTAGAEGGHLVFTTTTSGSLTEKMRIDPLGNVGIGTASPDSSYKLDVVGNVRVSGNIAAKYQDVAEWVESSQPLPAATVVVLNSNKSNQVVASSRAYDTRVAGVVSAQPGLILGERGDNKILVATTGRVRIKVDATRGAIRVGDLLVTSDKEGVAMKSRPINIGGTRIHRPGTLIGKALEPLAHGQGEILVLLSLQ